MIHILLFFIIKLIIICQLLNHVPLGDKGSRNENNSSNSISINNKDMVTHPSQGSCFEQSIQGYVEAFHGHHGPKRNQILVQDPFCHGITLASTSDRTHTKHPQPQPDLSVYLGPNTHNSTTSGVYYENAQFTRIAYEIMQFEVILHCYWRFFFFKSW